MLRILSALAARAGWGAALGLGSVLLMIASPAAAQSACQDGGNVQVKLLGVETPDTILMAQIDGVSYQGDVRIRVYCDSDDSPVTNAMITFSTTVPNSKINGQLATEPASVSIAVPNGEVIVTLTSTDPKKLTDWKARVGSHTVTVSQVYDQPLMPSDYLTEKGKIWAQTPELGSLVLFGAGAAGMAGYALARMRAGAKRRGRRGRIGWL